jgi:hypothetical protein
MRAGWRSRAGWRVRGRERRFGRLLYPHLAGAFPFVSPSRVTLHVGDPLYIAEGAERDRRILEDIAWHARRTIKEMLDANR